MVFKLNFIASTEKSLGAERPALSACCSGSLWLFVLCSLIFFLNTLLPKCACLGKLPKLLTPHTGSKSECCSSLLENTEFLLLTLYIMWLSHNLPTSLTFCGVFSCSILSSIQEKTVCLFGSLLHPQHLAQSIAFRVQQHAHKHVCVCVCTVVHFLVNVFARLMLHVFLEYFLS